MLEITHPVISTTSDHYYYLVMVLLILLAGLATVLNLNQLYWQVWWGFASRFMLDYQTQFLAVFQTVWSLPASKHHPNEKISMYSLSPQQEHFIYFRCGKIFAFFLQHGLFFRYLPCYGNLKVG